MLFLPLSKINLEEIIMSCNNNCCSTSKAEALRIKNKLTQMITGVVTPTPDVPVPVPDPEPVPDDGIKGGTGEATANIPTLLVAMGRWYEENKLLSVSRNGGPFVDDVRYTDLYNDGYFDSISNEGVAFLNYTEHLIPPPNPIEGTFPMGWNEHEGAGICGVTKEGLIISPDNGDLLTGFTPRPQVTMEHTWLTFRPSPHLGLDSDGYYDFVGSGFVDELTIHSFGYIPYGSINV